MKKLLYITTFIVVFYHVSAFAQLAKNTPCTALCLDANKSAFSGKMPIPSVGMPTTNPPCGNTIYQENNPLWFSFRAKTNNIDFSFIFNNCQGNIGQTVAIVSLWKGNDCQDLTFVDCSIMLSGSFKRTVVPDDIYYIQIDGLSGTQCNFIMSYDKTKLYNSMYAAPLKQEKACLNSTIKYTAIPPKTANAEYLWAVSPASLATIVAGTESKSTVSIKYNNLVGKVKLSSVIKYTAPCTALSQSQEYDIDVVADTVLKITKCDYKICEKDQPLIIDVKNCYPEAESSSNATHVVHNIANAKDSVVTRTIYYDPKTGCKAVNALVVNVSPQKNVTLVTLPPLLLCQGESATIKGKTFSCADAAIQPIKFSPKGSFECDTTYEMVVQCIEVNAVCRPYYSVFDCIKKSNDLDLSSSTFFPPNLSTTEFKGTGKMEYFFTIAQKDSAISKIKLNNAINLPAKVKYTYTINHKNLVSQKVCESKISVPAFSNTGLIGAEDFIIEPKLPCQEDIFVTKILSPTAGATYTWRGDENTIAQSAFNGLSFTFSRKNPLLKTKITLWKTACNQIDTLFYEEQTLNPKPAKLDFTIRGKSNICQNEISAYLIDKLPRGTKYKWTVSNGKIISASDSTWILVAWDGTKSKGDITLEASNNCGIIAKKTYHVALLQTCKKCIAKPGSLSLKFMITANKTSKPITVKHQKNSSKLGFDDTFAFVLHDGNANQIGNILSKNKTGIFDFDASTMKCNRVYYVTYVVGKDKNGFPDVEDKCYQSVTKGQPIGWLCKVKIPVSAAREEYIEEKSEDISEILVFPNPTNDKFFVVTPTTNRATISLFDMQGKSVCAENETIQLGSSNYEIPVSHLPKGVYMADSSNKCNLP